MNNFSKRTITGFSFIGIVIASVVIHPLVFAGLFLIVALLSLREFFNLVTTDQIKPLLIPTYFSVIFIYVSFWGWKYLFPEHPKYLSLNIIVLFLPFIIQLYRKSEKPFHNIAYTLLGVFYIVFPFILLGSFYFIIYPTEGISYGVLFGFFGIIWISDTGAYLVGSLIGKHRLFKRISPKKSWEGSIGGGIFAIGGAVLSWYLFGALLVWQWVILAIIILIVGTLGDLVESLLKRSLGVKDSGSILPGHGGLLDRFDNVFLSAPFVFVYLMII